MEMGYEVHETFFIEEEGFACPTEGTNLKLTRNVGGYHTLSGVARRKGPERARLLVGRQEAIQGDDVHMRRRHERHFLIVFAGRQ